MKEYKPGMEDSYRADFLFLVFVAPVIALVLGNEYFADISGDISQWVGIYYALIIIIPIIGIYSIYANSKRSITNEDGVLTFHFLINKVTVPIKDIVEIDTFLSNGLSANSNTKPKDSDVVKYWKRYGNQVIGIRLIFIQKKIMVYGYKPNNDIIDLLADIVEANPQVIFRDEELFYMVMRKTGGGEDESC